MSKVLLDTDILSEYFKGHDTIVAFQRSSRRLCSDKVAHRSLGLPRRFADAHGPKTPKRG